MNIYNNMSSINAHQTMMNTSANNVANANTDGFIPKSTTMSESAGGSVSANVRGSTDQNYAKSQTNIAKEIPDQMIALEATKLNTTTIKAQDEMFGSLLDIKA
jgi:flagellar hook protein FlgE